MRDDEVGMGVDTVTTPMASSMRMAIDLVLLIRMKAAWDTLSRLRGTMSRNGTRIIESESKHGVRRCIIKSSLAAAHRFCP